jgi:hypothetical protein
MMAAVDHDRPQGFPIYDWQAVESLCLSNGWMPSTFRLRERVWAAVRGTETKMREVVYLRCALTRRAVALLLPISRIVSTTQREVDQLKERSSCEAQLLPGTVALGSETILLKYRSIQ